MGRSASTPKRSTGTAANQHNTRHENGIVGPSKKLSKQKSNGHLNAQPRQADSRIPPTPPLPATPPPANGHARQLVDGSEFKMTDAPRRRPSVGGYSESSSSDSCHNAGTPKISVSEENHRRIDVNAAKNPAVHRDAGPLNLLITVLRSCPLADTIAILIVLLQIPPTFLTIVHLLFATLTFVPSSSNHSSLTFTDIFEGTLSTPSVTTILFVDFIVLVVWLLLWSPLQETAMDLSQTVIALTLGGGTSGRDAGFNNVLACFGIIGVSRFAHGGGIKKSGLRMLLPESTSGLLAPDSDGALEIRQQNSKGPHYWIRTVLALHILIQGMVRYIRDWYVRREKRDSMLNGLGDPEAAKGSISSAETAHGDSASHTPGALTPDVDLPSTANGSDRSSNPKNKKKAIAQVRSRQPLWAALASTKIVMAKEYETSRTAAESAGTNATDVNNLGNAPFNTEADRIWITYVGFDEVCFNSSHFPQHPYPNSTEEKDNAREIPGVDMSKPFFVRVNKSVWQPTRISPVIDATEVGDELHWGGDIFGLAPMSNYDCEFVSTVDGSLIFSTSVRTMQAPTADTASTPMLSPGIQQSPTTTLRTSIATAELKLADERNRQKRERKDQRSKINAARKEIDKLTGNISSSGGNDDRLRQKVQQSNLHAKQAEDAAALLVEELSKIEVLPEDDAREFKCAKAAWLSQKETHNTSRSDFIKAKQDAEQTIQALTQEVNQFQQKRERMQSRIAKLNGEHERITDANARGLDEAQRKATEREAKEADRLRTEMIYAARLDAVGPQIQELQQTLSNLWASIHAMQQAEYLASQAHIHHAPTHMSSVNPYDMPENNVGNQYSPWNPPNFVPAPQYAVGGHSMTPISSQQGHRTRGRSSSMLSNVSGFTQSSIDEPPMPANAAELIESQRQRQRSDPGSSSTSGSSGSIGDPKSPRGGPPKSPVPGHASGTFIGGASFFNPWDER